MKLLDKYFQFFVLFFVAIISITTPSLVSAQVDISGFIRNYNAVELQSDNEIIIGRNRLRLDLSKSFSKGEIFISNDIEQLYSASEDSLSYDLREVYVELFFANSDLRIGKQIISWGRTDGASILDILSPNDLSEFLTQDFSDLRTGVTAISYHRYFGSDYLQLVINPIFDPNEIPKFGSRWFPRPIVSTSLPTEVIKAKPKASLENVQLAGRFAYRSNLKIDLDLSVMYWHHPNPSYFKSLETGNNSATLLLREHFEQSLIAGYSGSVKLGNRLFLESESAFHSNREFDYLSEELRDIDLENPSQAEQIQIAQEFNRNSDGFLRERPWLISMIGLRYELFDTSVSTQIINEHIFDYDSSILQEKNFYYSSLQLQRSFARDTWEASLFGRYNYNGKDFWINPEVTYTGIDAFEASIGTQLFGGEEPDNNYGHLSFNNFADNTFGYLKVSAYF